MEIASVGLDTTGVKEMDVSLAILCAEHALAPLQPNARAVSKMLYLILISLANVPTSTTWMPQQKAVPLATLIATNVLDLGNSNALSVFQIPILLSRQMETISVCAMAVPMSSMTSREIA